MAAALMGRLARVEARIVEASIDYRAGRLAAGIGRDVPVDALRAELRALGLEIGARVGQGAPGRLHAAIVRRRYRKHGRDG